MEIPKQQILELLRGQGDHGKADAADQQLPGQVDPEQHAGILEELGIDPKELLARFGGLGGIGKKFGL